MNLEEAKLNDDTIPEGSKVVVNAWWLANNPEWFLEEESGTDAGLGGRADFRYLPFGGVEKIDVTERRGQFSLLLANHSTVVFGQLKA
ncbi:hypothetical protein AAC387_Pa09g2303 [Persea americana]